MMGEIQRRKPRARPVRSLYRSQPWLHTRTTMEEEPKVCYCCGKPAKDLDHKIRWRIGGALFDKKNLGWLCGLCHAIKTKRERKGYTYRYHQSSTGLVPELPLEWIKIPDDLYHTISNYGLAYIHAGGPILSCC